MRRISKWTCGRGEAVGGNFMGQAFPSQFFFPTVYSEGLNGSAAPVFLSVLCLHLNKLVGNFSPARQTMKLN